MQRSRRGEEEGSRSTCDPIDDGLARSPLEPFGLEPKLGLVSHAKQKEAHRAVTLGQPSTKKANRAAIWALLGLALASAGSREPILLFWPRLRLCLGPPSMAARKATAEAPVLTTRGCPNVAPDSAHSLFSPPPFLHSPSPFAFHFPSSFLLPT